MCGGFINVISFFLLLASVFNSQFVLSQNLDSDIKNENISADEMIFHLKEIYPQLSYQITDNKAVIYSLSIRLLALDIKDTIGSEYKNNLNEIISKSSASYLNAKKGVIKAKVRASLLEVIVVINSNYKTIEPATLDRDSRDKLGLVLAIKDILLKEVFPLSKHEYELIYGEDMTSIED